MQSKKKKKNGTDEPISKAGTETDIENRYVTQRGEGGMNWEIRVDIYTLPSVKQLASGNLLSV